MMFKGLNHHTRQGIPLHQDILLSSHLWSFYPLGCHLVTGIICSPNTIWEGVFLASYVWVIQNLNHFLSPLLFDHSWYQLCWVVPLRSREQAELEVQDLIIGTKICEKWTGERARVGRKDLHTAIHAGLALREAGVTKEDWVRDVRLVQWEL